MFLSNILKLENMHVVSSVAHMGFNTLAVDAAIGRGRLDDGADVLDLLSSQGSHDESLSENDSIDDFQRGFDAGVRHAEQEWMEKHETELEIERERVAEFIENGKREFLKLQAETDKTIVALAVAIAERILWREVRFDREAVLRQIHEAIKRVVGVEKIKIRINPLDESTVRGSRSKIMAEADAVRDMVIESDENIGRGGCFIESESGNIDALISTQLRKIEAALLES